jgi:hypothetical protein
VDPAPATCESHKFMESDSGKDAKRHGLREQRYTIRYPFPADAEMLELESGTRVSGVTSDLLLEDVSSAPVIRWRLGPESAELSLMTARK